MAPDSAFAVGSIRINIVPVYDIIWLKRDDWESQNDPMPEFPKGIRVQVRLDATLHIPAALLIHLWHDKTHIY